LPEIVLCLTICSLQQRVLNQHNLVSHAVEYEQYFFLFALADIVFCQCFKGVIEHCHEFMGRNIHALVRGQHVLALVNIRTAGAGDKKCGCTVFDFIDIGIGPAGGYCRIGQVNVYQVTGELGDSFGATKALVQRFRYWLLLSFFFADNRSQLPPC
jgi:hypothetical protein